MRQLKHLKWVSKTYPFNKPITSILKRQIRQWPLYSNTLSVLICFYLSWKNGESSTSTIPGELNSTTPETNRIYKQWGFDCSSFLLHKEGWDFLTTVESLLSLLISDLVSAHSQVISSGRKGSNAGLWNDHTATGGSPIYPPSPTGNIYLFQVDNFMNGNGWPTTNEGLLGSGVSVYHLHNSMSLHTIDATFS